MTYIQLQLLKRVNLTNVYFTYLVNVIMMVFTLDEIFNCFGLSAATNLTDDMLFLCKSHHNKISLHNTKKCTLCTKKLWKDERCHNCNESAAVQQFLKTVHVSDDRDINDSSVLCHACYMSCYSAVKSYEFKENSPVSRIQLEEIVNKYFNHAKGICPHSIEKEVFASSICCLGNLFLEGQATLLSSIYSIYLQMLSEYFEKKA